MNRETLKHIAISILIGASISFLSTLFQGLLDFLKNYTPHNPASVAAMLYYLAKPKV